MVNFKINYILKLHFVKSLQEKAENKAKKKLTAGIKPEDMYIHI